MALGSCSSGRPRIGVVHGFSAISRLKSWSKQRPRGQLAQNLTVDGVDLKSSVQTALDGLKTALQGVRDTTSAQAALPQLEKGSTEFDKLRDLAGKLPIDAKTAFAVLVNSLRPSIEDLFNKVLEIPGVAPIAKPVIDGLRAKLDTLSKAESKA